VLQSGLGSFFAATLNLALAARFIGTEAPVPGWPGFFGAVAVWLWLAGCTCTPWPARLGAVISRQAGMNRPNGRPGFLMGLGRPLESSADTELVAVPRIDVVLIVASLIFTDPTNFGGPAVY
jgi:hypothetical protein